ncbi:hypothetical protein V1J52_07235 [Streptomyces sp. TRM 70351]|uniref:hypothetical protein n=1 Tax=Streptomyces sp. TRM 70351 TaxID=3116552 RepID=UPI002E7ABD0D|nr:hypothetical protein [Streptomyces sp. TRM 70351]MEE1927989.1 hypothetical protein [Streptomyces sp. TRM 70351]
MTGRRRFEPARLVLGLTLLGLAALHLLRAHGPLADASAPLLGLLLPGALALAALTAVVTHLVRRRPRHRPLDR